MLNLTRQIFIVRQNWIPFSHEKFVVWCCDVLYCLYLWNNLYPKVNRHNIMWCLLKNRLVRSVLPFKYISNISPYQLSNICIYIFTFHIFKLISFLRLKYSKQVKSFCTGTNKKPTKQLPRWIQKKSVLLSTGKLHNHFKKHIFFIANTKVVIQLYTPGANLPKYLSSEIMRQCFL